MSTGSTGSRPHAGWQPPALEEMQAMLPQYVFECLLGRGGMGAVYKGRQKSLDRDVAIKILPPEAAEDDMQFVERFKNEARTMAKMNHPSIVHVYDFGETSDGQLYIVMEFIDGTDVAQMIQSQGKLPEDYALSITAHVCDALQYAHTHGVVHRDIKPANVLINMEGQVKVADFGLAKATDAGQLGLTKTNMAMGTPDFVSPEALMPGVPLDGRADLYAVGVMLYNMLTGTIPRGAFRMPSLTLNTDARFDKIISKSMEMDRELRYQTALDLRRDLDVILTAPAAKTGAQTIPAAAAQQALTQKPMGKGPGSPQQRGADAAVRKEAAAKVAVNKSSAGMIYGIVAAVVVIAVAALMFAGGGKKPVAAPRTVAEPGPKSRMPETKPAAVNPLSAAPAPASATLRTGEFTLRAADGKARGLAVRGDVVGDWDPGSELTWSDVEVAAGTYRITIEASGYRPREYSMELKVGGQTLPFDFRLDTKSAAKFGKITVGEITLPANARGITLLCTKVGAVDKYHENSHSIAALTFAPATGKPSGGAPSTSPPGTVLTFGGHRYQFLKGPFIRDEAEEEAKSLGGHLVTVTSAAEQAWIEATFGEFIGGPKKNGICRTDGNAAKWQTGEPWSYTSWDAGQPDPKQTIVVLARKGEKCPWKTTYWSHPCSAIVEWDGDGATKPAPAMPVPTAPVAAAPPLTAPVDLLALVDVKRDAEKGEWEMTPEGLRAKPRGDAAEILGFNITAPEEYDFEVEFTIKQGAKEASQMLPVAGRSLVWKMGYGVGDPTLFSLGHLLGGRKPDDKARTEAVLKRARLKAGQRYRSMVEVRKGSLRALLDGEELLKWSGDFQRLGVESNFSLRDGTHPGLGAYNTDITFHKAELRPPAGSTAAPQPIAVTTSTMPAAAPASPKSDDPRLAHLEAGFKTRYEADAQKPFDAAVAALDKSYVANGIARARAAAQAKGSLAEVTALDAEKAAIEKGVTVPTEDAAGTPVSLKALRGTYRTAYAKIAADRDARAAPLRALYVKALDAYVTELTKAGKIDEAQKVQALRDEMAAAEAAATADTPPPMPPATAASSPPSGQTDTVASNSMRRLAEWVLSHNGNLKVAEGSKRVYIKAPEELPAGKLDIVEITFRSDGITESETARLKGARDLDSLRIDGSKPLKLDFLRELSGLRTLNLSASVIGPEGWPLVGSLDKLQSLFLRGKVTDEQIAQLSGLKDLRGLNMELVPTGTGFAGMKASKKLGSLAVGDNGSAITDEGLGIIASTFHDLNSCMLAPWDNPCAVTNEGLKALTSLKSLTDLHFATNAVDDGAVEILVKVRGLKTLGIQGTRISAEGVEKLRKSLPGCSIRQ